MAWSTRQLAELAGVTHRTVRWYHEMGLLEEPDRTQNGYKQYRIEHLVRVLRVKRLTDLGLTPTRIRDVGNGPPADVFALLNEEIAAAISRLEAVRAELAIVASEGARVDLPQGFATVRRDLTDADRSLVLLYSRVFDTELMEQLRACLDRQRTQAEADFDFLAADADEPTRVDVARRYGAVVASRVEDFPALGNPDVHVLGAVTSARTLLDRALDELYNPAQLDVLSRLTSTRRTTDPHG